jgi:hypothetical protein
MHIIYGHKHDLKMEEILPTTHEPILSRTTTTDIETSVTTHATTTTTINTSLLADDETTPLIVRPERPVDTGKI